MAHPIGVEDLSQVPESERTHVLDLEFSAEELEALRAEAARRGVSLEDYLRWAATTTAEVVNAGGSSRSGGTA